MTLDIEKNTTQIELITIHIDVIHIHRGIFEMNRMLFMNIKNIHYFNWIKWAPLSIVQRNTAYSQEIGRKQIISTLSIHKRYLSNWNNNLIEWSKPQQNNKIPSIQIDIINIFLYRSLHARNNRHQGYKPIWISNSVALVRDRLLIRAWKKI